MKRSAFLAAAPAILIALAGCQSTQDVLEPSALVGDDSSAGATPGEGAAQPPQPAGTSPGTPPQAAVATQARVQFPPVIGAPDAAATPLNARLSARARDRGIGVAAIGDRTATLVMRGYFSTILEDGVTTVIYVWDVVDPGGTRVHRIQGQTRARGMGMGWDGVDGPTMEAVADQTIDQLATWLSGRTG